MIIQTWFVVLDYTKEHMTVECQCGEVFDIKEEDEYWDEDFKDYLIICPTCGLKGLP